MFPLLSLYITLDITTEDVKGDDCLVLDKELDTWRRMDSVSPVSR